MPDSPPCTGGLGGELGTDVPVLPNSEASQKNLSVQEQDRLRAEAEGANDFLTKPASSHEFIETVNRHLGE